jgi:uncharacterized pyridoxal phosphate-containing UPF0001 family protein
VQAFAAAERTIDVFVQVNTSQEESTHGHRQATLSGTPVDPGHAMRR